MTNDAASALPAGWTLKSLGDCCEDQVVQGEPTETPVSYVDIGSIDRESKRIGTTVRVTRSDAPTRARQWVQPGDILVSMTRPNLNAVALVPAQLDHAVASTAFDILRPKVGVTPGWLFARVQMREFVEDMCRDLQGVVYPAIRPKDVRRHVLPLPPVEEQERILSVLDAHVSRVDVTAGTLAHVRRNLHRYRASVLEAAIEGRLIPTEAASANAEGREYEPAVDWLARHVYAPATQSKSPGKKPRFTRLLATQTRDLRPLPAGWCWAGLRQLGELGRGRSKHRPRNDPRLLGGPYPFIQTGDIRRSNGRIEKYSETYSEYGLAQSRLWPVGTLCITIAANIAETGILAMKASFPDSVVGFVADGDDDLVRFVEFFLRTAKEDLARFAPATAQKNINLAVLDAVMVPLPPRPELERIVSEVSRLLSIADALESSVVRCLEQLARLRPALLRSAFEGRLM